MVYVLLRLVMVVLLTQTQNSLYRMSKIHPVFHILLLEPAPKNTKITENMEIDDDTEQEYEVKEILSHKQVSEKPYYLIK